VIQALRALGVVLLLGGAAHSAGVTYFYLTAGVPDANRVLVDMWVAQAQLLAASLYLAAFREARRGRAWQGLAAFAALTIIGFAAAMLPVLFSRAPAASIPVAVYLVCSVLVVAGAIRSGSQARRPGSGQQTTTSVQR
jgi:hypothetical protein